jgi:hypothetical protein
MNTDRYTEPTGLRSRRSRHHDQSTPRLTDAVRSRPIRRALVIGSASLLVIAVVLVWFQDGDATAGSQIAYLVAATLALGGFTLVGATLRAHRAGADERLACVRDKAYRIAYPILGIATGAALLAMSFAWETESAGFTLEPNHVRALLLGFAAAAVWLPPGVIAWREAEV